MFIRIDDAQIFAVAFGPQSAPAILGIGGWIGSWELWAGPFATLSSKWLTIAFDHRGSGATTAPLESITFERLVDDVFAVLDAYGVEHCVLAAESAGAAVALGAALKEPERITGLVLVDGRVFPHDRQGESNFLNGLVAHYEQTLDWFVQACVPERDCEPIKRWGRQILDRADPAAAVALQCLTNGIDLRPDLGRIGQRTLILHGQEDGIVPLEDAQALAEALPEAQLRVLPGAGHVPTMTFPEVVAGEIERFLTERSVF